MAFSYKDYPGDGSTTLWNVPFPFLSRDDVEVVDVSDESQIAFNWITDSQVEITPAVSNSVTFRIRRNTSIDSRVVDFQDATVLDERDLDRSANQNFFVAQEILDTVEDKMAQDVDSAWDAEGNRVKDVADPVDAQDAVTKNWAENAMTSQLQQASAAKEEAETSETNAATSESNAATSASNAATSESNAAASETAAASSASDAADSESAAATSETNAANSASAASTSEFNAASSETNAATSESNAASSASTASTAASNAQTSETNAANSASAASTSETNAATSESAAATSETNAANSASAASTSESNAADSESAAATSESNAASSESNAATSASEAATSASEADSSATDAANSASTAGTHLFNFQEKWLGLQASAPTQDLNGNPLEGGEAYVNSGSGTLNFYDGNSWNTIGTLSASDVKSLYESNSDTNAFTDSLKSKLDNLAKATQSQAETGTDDSAYMTALKTQQAHDYRNANSRQTFKSIRESDASLSGTTPELNTDGGNIKTWTLPGNATPTDGISDGDSLLLLVDDGSDYTISWPTMTWVGGTAPTLATVGYTMIEVFKVSGVLYGALVGVAS